jgi:hypothetical protein
MKAAFSGWLLEYEFAQELKDEFLLSRRWVFRQARKIDGPSSVEEKREAVERLVAGYLENWRTEWENGVGVWVGTGV